VSARRHAALGLAAALLAALLAPPAGAALEEYSSFNLASQEEDDESLLDHVLTRFPVEWRDEWRGAPQAFRSAQGCLTSGEWFLVNELKVRTPLGVRARFDLGLAQTHSNEQDFDVLSFGFRFPTRYGTAVAEFMPSYDKSRQDLALSAEWGSDTSAFALRATWGVEDVFNNLWAFRQTRVGRLSEPYLRHPYEPALRVAARGASWRAEAGGRWMTPGTKAVAPGDDSGEYRRESLWGTIAWARVEARALGAAWEVATTNQQVATTDAPESRPLENRYDFRRKGSVEVAARRDLGPRLGAQARWILQERAHRWGEGIGPGAFDGIDRLTQAELAWRMAPRVTWRLGGMLDRITIARRGVTPMQSYGSRTESRAYLGLQARFGRVVLQALEGIELDPEPYDVWLVHDKGFLHLQTTF
jgi:hypothetical protein